MWIRTDGNNIPPSMMQLDRPRSRIASWMGMLAILLALPSYTSAQAPGGIPVVPLAQAVQAGSSTTPSIPLVFEPNRGQADGDYAFLLRTDDFVAGTRADGFDVAMLSPLSGNSTVQVRWIRRGRSAANESRQAQATQRGEDPSAQRVHFWDLAAAESPLPRDLPAFARVRHPDAYQGIDLLYHTEQQRLEFDFQVRPGADPREIGFTVNADSAPRLNAQGDLEVGDGPQGLVLKRPVAYQLIAGVRTEIAVRFVARGNTRGSAPEFGFEVGTYDTSHDLVIDPVVEKALFFGSENQPLNRVFTDRAGNVYVVSTTNQPGQPVPPPPLALIAGTQWARRLTKLSPDLSTVLFTAYFSLSSNRGAIGGFSQAVAPNGDVVIATDLVGDNYNTSVTVGPYGFARDAIIHRDGRQIFLVRLTQNASQLAFSTILACRGTSSFGGIAIDSKGDLYVAANYQGSDYPYTPGFFGTGATPPPSGIFLTKLSPSGQLLYNAHINGADSGLLGLTLDPQDQPVLFGSTASGAVPLTPNAYQRSLKGIRDGYIVRLSADGKSLLTGTLVGGSGIDSVTKLEFDPSGNLLASLSASAESTDFPISTNAFQTTPWRDPYTSGPSSQFILFQMTPDGSSILKSTYMNLGSVPPTTHVQDSAGRIYLNYGVSFLPLLPPGTSGSFYPHRNEITYTYLARLTQDWSSIDYATYFTSTHITPLPNQRILIAAASTVPWPSGVQFPPVTDPVGIRDPGADPTIGSAWFGVLDFSSPQFCGITVTPTEFSFSPDGSSVDLSVSGPPRCPWYFSFPETTGPSYETPKLTIVPRAGYGNGTVRITAAPNNSSFQDLSTDMHVGESLLRFTQPRASCDRQILTLPNLNFSDSGDNRLVKLDIPDMCRVRVESDSPWVRFGSNVEYGGSTDLEVLYTTEFYVMVDPNEFGARSAVLKIGKRTLALTQEAGACTATLSPTEQTIPAAGGSISFALGASGSNCGWKAYLTGPGTLISPSEGIGNAGVQVSFQKNETNLPRSGTIFVAGKIARITQPGSPCQYEFRPPSTTFPKAGGIREITVIATGDGCTYNTEPTVDWLRVGTATVFGSGFVLFSAKANPSDTSRTGSLRILGTEYPVFQDGVGASTQPTLHLQSNPAGIAIMVGGVSTATPAAVSVGPQAGLAVEAPEILTVSQNERLRFKNWSNGGPRLQVIQNLSANLSLTATYTREYRITTSVQGAGTLSFEPFAADGFYEASSTVMVTATPFGPSRFVGWSGDQSGTMNPFSLQITAPRSLQARFESTIPGDNQLYLAGSVPAFRIGGQSELVEMLSTLLASQTAIKFGPHTQSCTAGGTLFDVGLTSSQTPAIFTLHVNRAAALALPPGQYSCDISIPRTDGGQPSPFRVHVPLLVEPSGGGGSMPGGGVLMAAVDGASFRPIALAPGSIFSLFGTDLATSAELATFLPLPTQLQETGVRLETPAGDWDMPLFYVSPQQLNVLVPETARPGPATLRLFRGGIERSSLPVTIAPASPALFTANSNGSGVPAGYTIRIDAGQQIRGEIYNCPEGAGSCVPQELEWGPDGAQLFLVLFGTGFRGELTTPEVRAGTTLIPVDYVGPQGAFVGLDQLNLRLPLSLRGRGELDLTIRHADREVNRVTLRF